MRDIKRIKRILKKIEIIWTKNPDLRLGQLLINIDRETDCAGDIFYFEDSSLEMFLDKEIEKDK
jgi:uncharacterized protein YihD (DUF1040 family)